MGHANSPPTRAAIAILFDIGTSLEVQALPATVAGNSKTIMRAGTRQAQASSHVGIEANGSTTGTNVVVRLLRAQWRVPAALNTIPVGGAREGPKDLLIGKKRSIKDGRHPGARRFVVKADGHQRHGIYDAQAIRQAPGEHLMVSGRQQKAGTTEPRCRANQRLKIAIGTAHGMGKKGYAGRIAGDPSQMLNHHRGALADRVGQLLAAIEPVHILA